MRRLRRLAVLAGIAVGMTVSGFALGAWIDDAQQVSVYRSTPDWKRMRDGRPGFWEVARKVLPWDIYRPLRP
jgi:hypothetical protein